MSAITVAGFPIDADTVLKKRGTHFDIPYEVTNHSRREGERYFDEPRGTWCYYVVIGERMLPPESFALFWLEAEMHERPSGTQVPLYAYYRARFADAGWHGGVTFYEKDGGIDGAERFVRIGCDFAHYWDEGKWFTYQDVEGEAKQTIDSLRGMFPFMRRCTYTGLWLPHDQMIEHEGRLYSPVGKAQIDEYRAKREAELTRQSEPTFGRMPLAEAHEQDEKGEPA